MRIYINSQSKIVHAVSRRLQTPGQRGDGLIVRCFCNEKFYAHEGDDHTKESEDWSEVNCGICRSSMAATARRDPEGFEEEKKFSGMSPYAGTRDFLIRWKKRNHYDYTWDERTPLNLRVELREKGSTKTLYCSKCGAPVLPTKGGEEMYQIAVESVTDRKLEEKLELLAGRDADSSGTMLGTGERDLAWSFRTKQRAFDLFDKFSKISGLEVKLTRIP